jgi:predicted aspartyl protease
MLTFARCLPGFTFVLLATGPVTPQPVADRTVTIRLAQEHWPVVGVWIGRDGPFEFLLDTGATVTMLNEDLAGRLAIRPTARVTLETVAGRRVVPYSVLPNVAVGPETVQDVEVVIAELPELRALGPGVCGVLGQNVLAALAFRLDYRARRLVFARRGEPGPAEGHRLVAEVQDGLVIVRGQAAGRSRPLRLVLDSGVSRLILRDELLPARELDPDGDTSGLRTAATSAGTRTLRPATLRRLSLERLTLSNVPAAVLQGAPPAGDWWDGLLPTSLFDWIFFDNRDGYIVAQSTDPDYRRSIRLQRGSAGR